MTQSNSDPETELIRKYQIAKYYVNSADCRNAYSYIKQCGEHDKLTTTKLNNQPISNFVSFLRQQCTARDDTPKEEYLSLIYGGKGLYFILDRIDSFDNRPYTGDELEILATRRMAREVADTSMAVFQKIAYSNNILYRFPFVLVGGPGAYHYNALKPEKTLPANLHSDYHNREHEREIGHARDALYYIYDQVISPYYEHLRLKYFDSLQFQYVLPIYLTGGNFRQESYDKFVDFCEKVHLRNPGPRVAYYSPIDKSIMAWMPTGGGTLIHELVHALMDNDFNQAPPWLSEGIASLYEEVDNRTFKPKDNYRIYYIREFKERRSCHLSISKLFSLSSSELTDAKTGMLYSAYARYFAKYLSDKGVLSVFYKRVRQANAKDNFIYELILGKTLNHGLAEIQDDWEQWLDRIIPPQRWQSLRYDIRNYIDQNQTYLKCR